MTDTVLQILFLLDLVAFLAAIFMHLMHRNVSVIRLYALQSLAVGLLLATFGLIHQEPELIGVALATIAVKAIVAPLFFLRLMRRITEPSANNYLSRPLTLLAVAAIVIFSYSGFSHAFDALSPATAHLVPLNWAIVFVSILLMMNRRGAFGHVIGILSLENGVVAMATLLGIAQPLPLELGVVFDLVVWLVVAHVFIGIVYRQFGTLNISEMRKLIEEE